MPNTRRRQALLGTIAIVLIALLLEGILAIAAQLSPQVHRVLAPPTSQEPPAFPDPVLGYRPNPRYPGHDRNGYRNPAVPPTAGIVALGDSQTYGTGVDDDEPWPRQLEKVSGEAVYGMAFGGWGPTQALAVLDEALAMQPRVIVHGFYFGNDLYDAFAMVYSRGQLPQLAVPETGAAIMQLERDEPLVARVEQLFGRGELYPRPSPLRHFLAVHSRLYGLMRATWRAVQSRSADQEWELVRGLAAKDPEVFELLDDGGYRTVFNSPYRLLGVDIGDPRIAEGLRVSLAAIEAIKQRCEAAGVRYVVLLIPTKQSVFESVVASPVPSFTNIVTKEASIRETTRAFLGARSIEYVDALEPLRAAIARREQPYPASHDDHPNVAGHVLIARAVDEYLKRPLASSRYASIAEEVKE